MDGVYQAPEVVGGLWRGPEWAPAAERAPAPKHPSVDKAGENLDVFDVFGVPHQSRPSKAQGRTGFTVRASGPWAGPSLLTSMTITVDLPRSVSWRHRRAFCGSSRPWRSPVATLGIKGYGTSPDRRHRSPVP